MPRDLVFSRLRGICVCDRGRDRVGVAAQNRSATVRGRYRTRTGALRRETLLGNIGSHMTLPPDGGDGKRCLLETGSAGNKTPALR